MAKIRWGILSTAKIGMEKVTPAIQGGQHCEVTAIASRSLDKAQAAAAKLGIAAAYDSYETLLAADEVDAIYNPLPNHLHVPWSVKALAAGKHVLCEKPIGLSAAEGQQLTDAGKAHPKLKLMEAFMYRHHPQWQKAKDIVNAGGVGELRTIQTFFSYFNDDPANVRNQADIGGGGMLDIGCYAISVARFIFDAEPQRVFGIAETDPRFKTDRLASGILDFGRGTSTFTCSTQLAGFQRVNILGDNGRVEIEVPFNPQPDQATRLWHQRDGKVEEISFPPCDQYTLQADLFAKAILDDTPVPTPIEDSVANMKVIEAVFASATNGGWA